jgi:S-adenosylmethionine uptake transporter
MPDPAPPIAPAADRPAAASGNFFAAAGWMLAACFGFAIMIGLIRHVADSGMHPFEIAFFRNFFGLVAVLPWIWRGGFAILSTGKQTLHAARAATGTASMLCWFSAVALMPLTEAVALSFTGPIFVTILAALMLGETVRLRRWTAVTVGFLGTLVILRPGAEAAAASLFAAGLVLASAVTSAASTITIKHLSKTEPANAIVAYMVIYLTPLTLVPALFVWTWPSWSQLGFLLALGTVATLAHLCYTRALREADASAVMPFDFARLVFSALIGFFVFHETSSVWTWVGAAIILASAAYITHREARALRLERARRPSPPGDAGD